MTLVQHVGCYIARCADRRADELSAPASFTPPPLGRIFPQLRRTFSGRAKGSGEPLDSRGRDVDRGSAAKAQNALASEEVFQIFPANSHRLRRGRGRRSRRLGSTKRVRDKIYKKAQQTIAREE
jgi:hypothetical protein